MIAYGDNLWDEWLERKEKVRDQLANFIGANRGEVGFTTNTSSGMNIVAEMVQGKGAVLLMQDEFPSSSIPFLHRNIPVSFVPSEHGKYSVEHIETYVTPQTKVLVTSYVQYCTGFRQDLELLGKWCRERDILFIVNATQAMGVFPIDVQAMNIDFLVFTGLKWTLAGYGIGGIYI
jgi:cysteine desulfurase/selenocysteine lyase